MELLIEKTFVDTINMKNLNIVYHNATATQKMRNQLNEYKLLVIWFTGLSGSGKESLLNQWLVVKGKL
jgi:adenylylsulfate kinase-like enzyme